MRLEHLTWPEVHDLAPSSRIILVPLGSFEQHGPHLPLTTDTDIVTALAARLEHERSEHLLCLPTLWLGHSTHHLGFPGTLSLNQGHYQQSVGDLCRSIVAMGGRRIFLLNGHGGNEIPVRALLRDLKTEFKAFGNPTIVFASYWSLAAESLRQVRESEIGGMGHACEMETSLMMHLHPERVHLERARRDGPAVASTYLRTDMQHASPIYLVQEFAELSASGTVGHPDLASSEKGQAFFAGIVKAVLAFIDDWVTWERNPAGAPGPQKCSADQ